MGSASSGSLLRDMRLPKSFVFIIIFLTVLLITAILIVVARTGSCPTPNFFCYGTNVCIHKDLHCNKHSDCPDGSDENPLDCSGMSGVIKQIEILRLKCSPANEDYKNLTAAISNEAILYNKKLTCEMAAPEDCRCILQNNKDLPDILLVNCTETNWKSVPWGEFGRVIQPMKLTFSNLSNSPNFTWNENELNLTSLKTITFAKQKTVFWKMFNLNENLRKIYIEKTQIESIEKNAFCGLKKLSWILIQQNPRLEKIESGAFCNLECLTYLTLFSNKLKLENYTFKGLPYLLMMDLRQNEIENIGEELFSELKSLEILILNNNRIKTIDPKAFINNAHLHEVDLSNNLLTNVDPDVFTRKDLLRKLILSYNQITELPPAFMTSIKDLEELELDGLDLVNIDLNTFDHMGNLNTVYFNNYLYCSNVPKVRLCFPNANPDTSSRMNLLESQLLRYFVWFLGIGILTGNGLVIFMRLYFKKKNKSPTNVSKALEILVNNLAVSDLLMSIYVYTIAFKDLLTRDTLNKTGYAWLRSWLCQGIGTIYVISYETSLLFLTLISLERYFVVAGRINSTKIGRKLAMVVSGIIWMTTIILALSPTILLSNSHRFYGSNYLCIPHFLDEPKGLGYEYSALIYIGINSICVLFITMSYTRLFLAVRRTRKETPDQNIKLSLALRFTILASAEIICSSPMIVGKIMALAGYDIKNYTAFIICLLPFNSAINPLLYTLTTGEVAKTLRGWITKFSSCVLRSGKISNKVSLVWGRLRSLPSLDNKENETGDTDDPKLTPNELSHRDSGISEGKDNESSLPIRRPLVDYAEKPVALIGMLEKIRERVTYIMSKPKSLELLRRERMAHFNAQILASLNKKVSF